MWRMNPLAPVSGIRNRLAQLARLNAGEWRILIAAVFLLPATALCLRLLGYPRTRSLMQRLLPRTAQSYDPAIEVPRVTRLVGVASRRGVYKANCLRQALVVWWLLARRGIETDLVIGVRKDGGDFSAHAWVEFEGRVIIGGDDAPERYRPMP
jgi:hypothetical protein